MKLKKIEPWLFLAPALLVYVGFVLLPVLWSMIYSLFDWNGIASMKFVGVANYVRMFKDASFITSFQNNIFFMIIGSLLQIFSGLIMAVILSNIVKFSNLLRVLYFMPSIISSMAICKIFDKLLSVEPRGVIAAIMESFRINQVAFLAEPEYALLAVIIIDAYKFCGLYMVIFYTAFMALPRDVEEAAYIDGCTWLQQYIYIKFPMILNVFFVVFVIVVNGTLKSFDVPYILTHGGPGMASELTATYMYKIAFRSTYFGYGSALSVFILFESLLAVGLLRFLQIRSVKQDE
jgi:raffinose/stachyose/melibiose transport system permease protein